MYLKKGDYRKIQEAAEEIKRLSRLEGCGLRDEFTEKQRLWLTWFDSYANTILQALSSEETPT